MAGDLKTVKRLRDDSLLLECVSYKQAINLLSLRQFAGTPVQSAPHRTLNTCRGIIRDRERCLQSLSEDEIAEELKPQGISSVKRFSIKKDGKTIYTNTYLLSFNSASLPSEIKAGYHNIRVEVYIPNPLRCFNCQQYGHGSRTCKKSPACRRCCSNEHDSDSCSSSPYCCNCKGDHMPSSKQCSAWIRESAINRLKHEKNISFPEARKLVLNTSSAPLKMSYSATVKNISTRTVSCQTPKTWTDSESIIRAPVPNKSEARTQTNQPSRINSQSATSSTNLSSRSDLSSCSAATSSQRSKKKPTCPRPAKIQSDRLHKGEDDQIQTFNKYGALDDMDVEHVAPLKHRTTSASPRRGRLRSPIHIP